MPWAWTWKKGMFRVKVTNSCGCAPLNSNLNFNPSTPQIVRNTIWGSPFAVQGWHARIETCALSANILGVQNKCDPHKLRFFLPSRLLLCNSSVGCMKPFLLLVCNYCVACMQLLCCLYATCLGLATWPWPLFCWQLLTILCILGWLWNFECQDARAVFSANCGILTCWLRMAFGGIGV